MFNGNGVADGPEKFKKTPLLLRLLYHIVNDLDINMGFAAVLVEIPDLFHKPVKVDLPSGVFPVVLCRQALHGDPQPVQPRIDQPVRQLRRQQRGVGHDVHRLRDLRLLRVPHHFRNIRFSNRGKAEHLQPPFKTAHTVNALAVQIHVHK